MLNCARQLTADGKISNQATEVKMDVHIGFVKLYTAVTTDGDISNQAKKVKMTVHIDLYLNIHGIYWVMTTTSNQATETKINCMLLSCHVRASFRVNLHPRVCLNVKELFARSRHHF